MLDDEREEEELDLTSPKVVTKYKSAADIVNRALQLVLSECKPKARIVHLCERGDAFIGEQSGNVYKKKKIERGVAFPTCISVNNVVCHFSPFASDETVLERGDMVKIDMGCHIDGFIAVLAHTHVIQEGPVTGRKADVIAAANTAAEVALRFVRPGKKNKYMTEAIQKVADAYDCKIVQGVLSHKLKRNKVLPNVSSSDTRVADAEFEENEVYAIDIVTSTGEGKPKLLDEKQTTIYKRAMERNYNLKMEASRFIFNEINQKFPIMPFTARALEENRARLGLVECVNHDLLQPYPVLHEKPGDFVAHVKLTVLLLPNGSDRVNSQPLQELQPTKTVEDPEIKAWLALATKKKKGGGKKKKAKKSCKGDEQFHAKGTESSQVDVTDSLQSNSTLECSSSKVAISDLHDDLCSSILLNLQLPLKGLGQAMLVSKQWKKVVCSTHFICEHSNANIEKDSQILVMLRDKNDIGKEVYHLYEDICRDDPLVPLGGMSRPWERRPKIDARTLVPPVSGCSSLIGTVEGVICLEINTEPRNKMVIFWNPITSRHVSLPLEKIYQVRGFGYDNRSRQFKVLSHSSLKNPPFQVGTHRLQVYPISSPFRRLSSDECYYRNVYHAGSIHWVEFAKKWRILTFDCSNDVFNTFDLPLELTTWAEDLRGEKKDLIVNSFNQSLKVYSSSFDGVKWMTQIWTMKCYGDSSSWEKEKLLSCLPNNFMVDYRQVIRREILWSIRCVRHNIVCRAKSNGSGDIIPTVNHDYHFEGLEVGVTRDFRPTIMLLDT